MRKKIILGVLSLSLLAGVSYEAYGYLSAGATCKPKGYTLECNRCSGGCWAFGEYL